MKIGFLKRFFGLNTEKNISEKSQLPSIPVVNISATSDQISRRIRSEDYCKTYNIPVYKNPNSLFVDTDDNVNLRTQTEVVDRALALMYIGLKSEGLEQIHLDEVNKEFNVLDNLSSLEKEYVNAVEPSEQQVINANWRYEGLHVLLWALGYIESLKYPNEMCHVADDVKIIYQLGARRFRQNSKLRSKKEILDQADLILRLHWACVNARVNNQQMPSELNNSVIIERHHTLNWLIKYMNKNWDEVTTDT
jgi:hypothetical protein